MRIMKHNSVVHFEIHADDVLRARDFYRNVFGWVIEKFESPTMDYWMVMTTPKGHHEMGINGGLLKRPTKALKPQQGTNAFVCTVSVEDFDKTSERILEEGGHIATPKFPIKTPMGKS